MVKRIDALHLLKTGPLTQDEDYFLHYFERSKEHKLTDYAQFRRIVRKYFPAWTDYAPETLPEDFSTLPF